jgi:membrane-bound lytic murein transglycosylase B/chaperonin cofactor prefoldin
MNNKPSCLIDIKNKETPSPKIVKKRVDLSRSKIIYLPIKKIAKISLIFFAVFSLIYGFAQAPSNKSLLASSAQQGQSAEEERQYWENQLQELEKQIDDYEKTIATYKKQGDTLSSEIKKLEAKISQLNLQIKAVTLNLKKLDQEISETSNQIASTESELSFNRDALAKTLMLLYETGDEGLLDIMLKNPKLSDFYGEVNNLLAVKDSLKDTVAKIADLHQKLVDQKEQLALEKLDVEQLKAYQESQKLTIKKTQDEKANLLKVTKGQETKYQQMLQETKKSAAEIRSRIFKLLGGGEMTFGDAYKIAKMAEDATGVRAAFLLAILDGESKLGKNVGKCSYTTAMHPTRDIPIFLKLCKELNLNPNSVTVSCPNSDGVYGGAMGPAQFIPSTWNAYKDRIASITGHNPPNPWNNADAFIAAALYLKDLGADQKTTAAERKAAAKYYAGSRWSYYLWSYGQGAIDRAERFADDIKTITS